MVRSGGRTFGLVGIGLVTVLAASSAEPPAPPGAAFAPPRLGEPTPPLLPHPLADYTIVPPAPIPAPPAPPLKPAVRQAPVVQSVEPDITEPVTTVHRFEGKYLGGDASHALVYVQTGPETAEIRSRPLANTIPAADTDAKDDVRRIKVPVGAAVWHNGRVFLTAKRELLVIDPRCHIDWKFALPGKPDNGEKLLGIVGFYEDKLVLVAQHEVPSGGADLVTSRVLTFDTETGRQIGFATIKGGFDTNAELSLDAPHGTIVAVTRTRYQIYELATGKIRWTARIPASMAAPSVSGGAVFATTYEGIGMPGRGADGFELVARAGRGTAAPLFIPGVNTPGRAYLPLISSSGQFALATYEIRKDGNSVVWWAFAPKQITTTPVVCGESAYFVAGNSVFRTNTANGAVCWKQTVPLKPGEALTELAFADGELRASGPGVLVRITDRAEPRAVFNFGWGFSLGGGR